MPYEVGRGTDDQGSDSSSGHCDLDVGYSRRHGRLRRRPQRARHLVIGVFSCDPHRQRRGVGNVDCIVIFKHVFYWRVFWLVFYVYYRLIRLFEETAKTTFVGVRSATQKDIDTFGATHNYLKEELTKRNGGPLKSLCLVAFHGSFDPGSVRELLGTVPPSGHRAMRSRSCRNLPTSFSRHSYARESRSASRTMSSEAESSEAESSEAESSEAESSAAG